MDYYRWRWWEGGLTSTGGRAGTTSQKNVIRAPRIALKRRLRGADSRIGAVNRGGSISMRKSRYLPHPTPACLNLESEFTVVITGL